MMSVYVITPIFCIVYDGMCSRMSNSMAKQSSCHACYTCGSKTSALNQTISNVSANI